MKIAMIGQKRVPSREGGIEVVVTELTPRMAALGHQVDCYNRWEPSVQRDMQKVSHYRGVRLLRVRTFRSSSLNAIVYAVRATCRALFGRYDVVHFHAEGPSSMVWLPHLFRIPTVVTIHGLDWQRAKWGGFATRFLRFGEKMAARYADELIVLSQGARDYFQERYGRESLFIPNGIEVRPSVGCERIRQKWQLEKDGYVLFVARLVPEKGLHYLLEAFRGLDTAKRLVIAGKIDRENPYVTQICEQAGEDARVLMTDFVEGETLWELMCNASAYVLPSDIEGMSISLLEALSCGQRCLLSDIPENRETAGTYARYFRHGDAESLRTELGRMLTEEKDAQAAQRCVQHMERDFNWDTVTARTLEAYGQAVSRARGQKKNAARSA